MRHQDREFIAVEVDAIGIDDLRGFTASGWNETVDVGVDVAIAESP